MNHANMNANETFLGLLEVQNEMQIACGKWTNFPNHSKVMNKWQETSNTQKIEDSSNNSKEEDGPDVKKKWQNLWFP